MTERPIVNIVRTNWNISPILSRKPLDEVELAVVDGTATGNWYIESPRAANLEKEIIKIAGTFYPHVELYNHGLHFNIGKNRINGRYEGVITEELVRNTLLLQQPEFKISARGLTAPVSVMIDYITNSGKYEELFASLSDTFDFCFNDVLQPGSHPSHKR